MVQLDEGLAGERTTVRELFAKAGRVSGAIRPYEFAGGTCDLPWLETLRIHSLLPRAGTVVVVNTYGCLVVILLVTFLGSTLCRRQSSALAAISCGRLPMPPLAATFGQTKNNVPG
jgi:hypothetical protein